MQKLHAGNVQVNIPFAMLYKSHLDRFVSNKLNPEIGLDAFSLDEYSSSDFQHIAAQLHENALSVTLHAPFIDMSPGSPDTLIREATRRRFEQVLRLVPVFRAKTVVCHANYEAKRYSFIREIWIENSLKTWKWLGKNIKDAGAGLMLENVYERGPEDMRILFENLEEYGVGLCMDIGHQTVFSRTPLEKWLESLGEYIGQVHLHDNFGKQDEHLAPGKGSINFSPLFDYLNKRKKAFPVMTLEPHKEEDLQPAFEYLAKISGQ
jgi:sugar phosphate isomerase/epimerase